MKNILLNDRQKCTKNIIHNLIAKINQHRLAKKNVIAVEWLSRRKGYLF